MALAENFGVLSLVGILPAGVDVDALGGMSGSPGNLVSVDGKGRSRNNHVTSSSSQPQNIVWLSLAKHKMWQK